MTDKRRLIGTMNNVCKMNLSCRLKLKYNVNNANGKQMTRSQLRKVTTAPMVSCCSSISSVSQCSLVAMVTEMKLLSIYLLCSFLHLSMQSLMARFGIKSPSKIRCRVNGSCPFALI